MRVAVVGGGISGLTAAYRLSRLAPDDSVVLIERSSRIGGKIASERVDGFVFDGGPDSFLTRKPAGVALCEELGIADRLIGRSPQPRGSSIFHSGRLYPLPEGFSGLVPSDTSALEASGLLSKEAIEQLQNPGNSASPGGGEESVADFFVRRFGREAFDVMIEPLVSGVFAGDARALSLDSAFPHLSSRARSAGSPPASAAGKPGNKKLPPFVSFASGMGTLVETIGGQIDPSFVALDTRAVELHRRGRGYSLRLESGERIDADAVVLAVPPAVVAEIAAPLSPRLAEGHARIETASTVIVNLGYRSDDLPDAFEGYGYLSPSADHRAFHGCSFSSNKWLGRAPTAHAAIRLYGGRFGERELFESSEEETLDAARRELSESIGLTAAPVVSRVSRWSEALPQYNLGYGGVLEGIRAALEELPGLYLAGAAYGGVGIPDCIRSGDEAAAGAAAYLNQS